MAGLRAGGTSLSSSSCAATAVVRSSTSPIRLEVRRTWVSTGSTPRASANISTTEAVLGPTPGSEVRYSRASGTFMARMNSRS